MSPRLAILAVGLAAAVTQVVLLRECLTVFLGNELIIGMALAVWLAAGGLGSVVGVRRPAFASRPGAAALLAVVAACGLILIRASRLVMLPGETASPLLVALVLVLAEGPVSLLCGYLFGALAARSRDELLYGVESGGMVLGGLLVWGCVLAGAPGGVVIAAACAPLALACRRSVRSLAVLAGCAALLLGTDRTSSAWKYAAAPSSITYGREGEVAVQVSGRDTTVLLNSLPYRSNIDKAYAEQATHLAMAQRPAARRVLVVHDRGQVAQLGRYTGLQVDCIESEPLLAAGGCRVAGLEQLRPGQPYDVILLGSGMPLTTGENRFYTTASLRRLKRMLSDSGVVSFTLPFSANYLSSRERRLHATLVATLREEFADAWVVPGEGYTYMASKARLPRSLQPVVATEYLAGFVLPSLSRERLSEANAATPAGTAINSTSRPAALGLGLQQWAEQYGLSLKLLLALLVLGLAGAAALLPRSQPVLSIGTSGLTAATSSMAVMILFQASHGTLYSQMALLMAALTAGFAAGGLWAGRPDAGCGLRLLRRHADPLIGLLCGAGMWGLAGAAQPPAWAFLLVNFGCGALCGAQFALERSEQPGSRWAADLFGGVAGAALAGTLIIPSFGVTTVALCLVGLKITAWMVARANPFGSKALEHQKMIQKES